METKDQSKTREYNGLLVGALLIILLSSLIRSGIKLFSNFILDEDITVVLISFFCEIANAGFLIAILLKKKWGVYALFTMLLAQIPINLALGCEDIISIIISSVVRMAAFSLLLLIKKDGHSGWEILFGKSALVLSTNNAEIKEALNERPVTESPNIETFEKGNSAKVVEQVEIQAELFTQHKNSRDCKLSLKRLFKDEHFSRVLIICLLIILIVIGLLIAYNGRYTTIGESNVPYDKWKNEVVVPSYSDDEESSIQLELKQDLKLDGTSLTTGKKSTEWKNLASIYRILKRQKYSGIGNDLQEFVDLMGKPYNRNKIYSALKSSGIIHHSIAFSEFSELVYPATETQYRIEEYRQWVYNEFNKEFNMPSYSSFCDDLYEDDKLKKAYNIGIELGLEIGSFEEFVKHIKQ